MKNCNPLISIIIPVFNVSNKLDTCIKSIINQTYSNLEIILIDDGSTDDSLSICEKYKKSDSRIKLISIPNGGVSNARNIGIENSTGMYIGFVDSDDYIDENMFEILYYNMNINNADLSTCGYQIETDDNKVLKRTNLQMKKKVEIMNQRVAYEKILNKDYFSGYCVNKLFKSDILKSLSFNINIYICEDLLMVCEYLKQCKTIVYDNSNLYHYIQYKNSSWNKPYSKKWSTILDAYDNIIKIYRELNINLDEILMYTFFKVNLDLIYKIKKSNIEDNNTLSRAQNNRDESYKLIMKSNLSIKKKVEVTILYLLAPFVGLLKSMRNKFIYRI